jgi:chemotaxis protein histidine kinase CheA
LSTDTHNNEDEFQKELVELFGQEAQEWLVQIDAALTELGSQPASDRHSQLVEAIVRAITSLGGSAATINLPDVERATFALLPFIEIIRDRTTATNQDYFTVRQQFSLVRASVGTATGIALDPDRPVEQPVSAPGAIDVVSLLNSLRELQETCARTRSWTRHLIQNAIRRLEQGAAEGKTQIEPDAVRRMLEELTGADDELYLDVQRALPDIKHMVDTVKARPSCRPLPTDDLMSWAHEVERLHKKAQHINAVTLVTFLAGLRNFFTLVAQRHLGLPPNRLEAVAARIMAVAEMTHEWVQSGQEEREAIVAILPAPR